MGVVIIPKMPGGPFPKRRSDKKTQDSDESEGGGMNTGEPKSQA
jgi:hypothetical protein